MKLISLNAWGGKMYQPLIKFINKHSKDTDIFCFQEVFKTTSNMTENAGFRLNLYEEFFKLLPEHKGYFATSVENYIAGASLPNFISGACNNSVVINFNLSWGLATFIHKKFKVTSRGDFFVFRDKDSFNPKDLNTLPRNMQYLTFTDGNKKFIVCNLHGIWQRGEKIDTSSRISQSEQINKFLDKYKEEAKILAGDFNLNIDTQSLKILEKNLINLIKEYKILTTRSKLYSWEDKFADYILVSDNTKVINFEVPTLEISDHLPMIVEFE